MVKANIVYSGFNNKKNVPYIHVMKSGSFYDQLDTCKTRIDTNQYIVEIVTKNFAELEELRTNVETKLRTKSLQMARRQVLSIDKLNEYIEEKEKGIYVCESLYDIMSQKTFVDGRKQVAGDNFFESLFNWYKVSALYDELKFSTTKFVHESWERPYMFVPRYNITEDMLTTCTRGDNYNFNLVIEHTDPVQIESWMETVDDELSYSVLNITNKFFAGINWLGNTLEEIEMGIWQGSINYECRVH